MQAHFGTLFDEVFLQLLNQNQLLFLHVSVPLLFLKHRLINGLDDIGITLQRENLIQKFEGIRKDFYPSTETII